MTVPSARLTALALAAVASVGCAPGQNPTPDAGGGDVDAGPTLPPVEPVVPSPCDADRIQGVTFNGTTVTFTADTTDESLADVRPLDIGPNCGNPATDEWAPQIVAEITVPGTGHKALSVDTRRSGTQRGFLTVVQVRRTCGDVPTSVIPAACIGPTNTEIQARGVFPVEGGEKLYLVLTGYTGYDGQQLQDGTTVNSTGKMSVKLDVIDAEPPVLTAAEANYVGESFEVRLTGTDGDSNAAGGAAWFLDAAGKIVDIDGNGVGDESDVIANAFDVAPTGASFEGEVSVPGVRSTLVALNVAKVRVRAIDNTSWTSEPLEVSIGELQQVGVDETCNQTARCAPGLSCTSGLCAAPPAAVNACAGAVEVVLEPADDNTAVSKVLTNQVLGAGAGGLEASCASTPGKEIVYGIAIPQTGKWDLVATTAVTGVAVSVDTVLSLRSSCADSNTELSCNDEIASQQDSRSIVSADVTGLQSAYVIADYYQGITSGTKTFKIQFTLRPVLPTGASCDKTQKLNRCDRGYCNVDTLKCP